MSSASWVHPVRSRSSLDDVAKDAVPEMVIAGMAVGVDIGAPIKAVMDAASATGRAASSSPSTPPR